MPVAAACIPAISLLLFSASSEARRVDIKDVTALSSHPAGEDVTYDARNLVDGKASTAWVEGEDGSGLGSWVSLGLGGERNITRIVIWNGYWYSWDFWNRHNRVKELEVEFSDGESTRFELPDKKEPFTITLPKPVKTESVKLKIISVHRGTTFNDTCMSEVAVYDDASEGWHTPASTKSSGFLSEDGDGSYLVENTFDGLSDTMWCENMKSDGAGSWFEYRFKGPVPVSRWMLMNGNAYSPSFWMKSNRATSATLTFSDGGTETVSLKDFMMKQTITFPERITSSVRVRFNEVKAGTEYNDLCISESYFGN